MKKMEKRRGEEEDLQKPGGNVANRSSENTRGETNLRLSHNGRADGGRHVKSRGRERGTGLAVGRSRGGNRFSVANGPEWTGRAADFGVDSPLIGRRGGGSHRDFALGIREIAHA